MAMVQCAWCGGKGIDDVKLSSPSKVYTAFTQVTSGSVVADEAEEMCQSSSLETYRAPMV